MNKKVVLYYPGDEDSYNRYHWFPFPYLTLAPELESAGFEVVVVDARVEKGYESKILGLLDEALFVGISCMTGSWIRQSVAVAEKVKAGNPRVPIVWGGYHPSLLPELTIREPFVDICVLGRAEEVVKNLALALHNGVFLADLNVSGLCFKIGNTIINRGAAPEPVYSEVKEASYECIDVEKYRSVNNIASILTMRGCPFRCTFCNTSGFKTQYRTLEQIFREIDTLTSKYRFNSIFFHDSILFVNKKRALTIAKMLNNEFRVLWKADARANSFNKWTASEFELLVKSGLRSLFIGQESGSQGYLDIMRKGITPEDGERLAKLCYEYGIEYYVSFMHAMPRETVDDFRLTLQHIERLRKNNPNVILQYCIFQPLPGTVMYQDSINCGYVPPSSLLGWAEKNVAHHFDDMNPDDITWMPKQVRDEYIQIFRREFPSNKSLFKKEQEGTYVPPLRAK